AVMVAQSKAPDAHDAVLADFSSLPVSTLRPGVAQAVRSFGPSFDRSLAADNLLLWSVERRSQLSSGQGSNQQLAHRHHFAESNDEIFSHLGEKGSCDASVAAPVGKAV